MATSPRSPLGILHDRMALIIAAFVPISAIPVASNRASIWLLWTALLAATAAFLLLRSWQLDAGWKPRFLTLALPFSLGLATLLWATLQLLPLGRWFPILTQQGATSLSVLPSVGMSAILRLTGYLILAALVVEIASKSGRVRRVAQIIFAGIVLHAVWAMVALQMLDDFSLWGAKTSYQGVATGTFINRNSFATFLGLGLVLGAGLLAEPQDRPTIRQTRKPLLPKAFGLQQMLIGIGMVFLLIVILATESRLGLASALIGLSATMLVVLYLRGVRPLRIVTATAVLGTALLAVTLLLGAEGTADRFLFSAADGGYRLAIYSQTLGMIAERPFLGYGLDTFSAAFEGFRAEPLTAPVTHDLAHNTYLALWSELGLIGGSLPLLALLIVAATLVRRLSDDRGFPGIAAAALGALTLAATHSLGDFSLEIPANAYLLTAIAALGLGRRKAGRGTLRA